MSGSEKTVAIWAELKSATSSEPTGADLEEAMRLLSIDKEDLEELFPGTESYVSSILDVT